MWCVRNYALNIQIILCDPLITQIYLFHLLKEIMIEFPSEAFVLNIAMLMQARTGQSGSFKYFIHNQFKIKSRFINSVLFQQFYDICGH